MKRFRDFLLWLKGRFADQRTYYWLFLAVLLVPNLFLCFTETMPFWGKVALISVPGAVWMALLAAGHRPGMPLWCLFPVLVFGAFQLVLLYLFGNSIIAVDMLLNVATTNSGEAMELLGKLVPAIVGVVLLYVPTLALGALSVRLPDRLTRSFRRQSLWRAGVLFLLGVGAMVGARVQDPAYRARLDLWPVNIGYNLKVAVERWRQSERYAETSRDFRFEARSERPDSLREVYVMVVGETARALNWQLYGYPRETNPCLARTEGLILFRDMLTQANATHKSVPIILSAASAENYDILYTHKSVLTAFREAGFRTAFLSNQLPNGSFIDHFGAEADTMLFLKAAAMERGEVFNPYDDVLLQSVDELLADTSARSRKLFVVLHTYGSHFDYQERYAAQEAYFRPAVYESVSPENRTVLVNAYDNSIRATDRFLSDLIGRLRALPDAAAALLYASDHGEDIYDDRRNLFLHASPIPTYYQLHIPCLLWLSPRYDALRPEARTAALANAVKPMTTNIVFHTLLELGGIETPHRNDSLAVTSACFTAGPRHFLNDHNKPVALDRLELRSLDVDMFRRLGLDFPFAD
ncbi:MAG: lipid A phosphoethanolamine transferase [Rikenella sp.]|nr:lipid A phosphoethanolamine transferase [Rikenella sp.]